MTVEKYLPPKNFFSCQILLDNWAIVPDHYVVMKILDDYKIALIDIHQSNSLDNVTLDEIDWLEGKKLIYETSTPGEFSYGITPRGLFVLERIDEH